jgi:hypothetical protein
MLRAGKLKSPKTSRTLPPGASVTHPSQNIRNKARSAKRGVIDEMLGTNCSSRNYRGTCGGRLSAEMNVVGQIDRFYRSLGGAGVGKGYLRVIYQTQGGFNFIGPFYKDNGLGRT